MQITLYMYKQDALILSQEFALLKTEINTNPTQQTAESLIMFLGLRSVFFI